MKLGMGGLGRMGVGIRDLFRKKSRPAVEPSPLVPPYTPEECVRLQAALSDLQKKYGIIYEHSPLLVAMLDAKGVVRDINPRVKDWLGYEPREIIGRGFDSLPFATPESMARGKNAFMRRLAGARIAPYEVEFKNKNGETVACEVHGVVLRTAAGVVEGELALMVNVNDRIRAQEAIIESERKYRAMFEMSPETIMLLDTRGNVLDMNPRVEELLGISPDEIIGKNLLMIPVLSMRDRLTAIGNALKRMRGKTIPPYEMTFHGKEGRVRIGEIRGKVLRGTGDKIVGDVIIINDVTEKKAIEKELKESEKRFRQVAAQTGAWIWEMDAEGIYTYASPVVEKVLGFTPEELVGKKHFYDLFVPEEREQSKKMAFEAFARKEPIKKFINKNLHKNGHVVILETSGVPILDDRGNLTGYRGADTDDTARIKMEEELRKSLAFRTEILATMSHELRIPLANILGFAGLLVDEKRHQLSDDARRSVTRIISNAETLLGMVNDILDAATIDRGKLEVTPEKVDLNALIGSCVERMRGMRAASEVALSFHVERDLTVYADREKLEAIIQNLLSNALKFTDRGEVAITAAVCRDVPEYVDIVVRDTGLGIPEDKRAYVFEKFAQVKTSAAHGQRGTGLGLYIVKGYAELMGGTITLESEEEKGSAFTVRLPIKASARSAQ